MAKTVSIVNNGGGKYTITDSDRQTRVVNQAQASVESAKSGVKITGTPKPTPSTYPSPSASGTAYSNNTSANFDNTEKTVLINGVPTPVTQAVIQASGAKNLGLIRSNLIKYGQLTKAEASDSTRLLSKWAEIVAGAANDPDPANRDPFKYAAALQKAGFKSSAGTQTGYTGPTTYPSITNAEDAKSTITKVFQSQLNRLPTDKEVADITKALNADEKKPANVKTVTPVKNKEGKVISYQTTGGTNAEQFLTDYIQGNPALKKEATAILTQAPSTTDFLKNKKIFNDAIAALGSNPTPEQIAKVKATTTYGQGLTEVENIVKNMARSSSAANTPEELAKIAEDAYNQGLRTNSAAFQEFVNGQLSYQGAKPAKTPTVTPTATTTPTTGARTPKISPVSTLGEDGVTDTTAATPAVTPTPTPTPAPTPAPTPVTIGGPGGQTLTNLKNVALKNGVNLDDSKYANQIADWVKDIKAGADPEKYYAQIRSIAGEGKNNWIRKQLAAGQNLKDIYATAINQIAGAFGLDAESIDLNDSIFSKIFTDKGVVDNKTLASILHSDPRWGGSTEQEKRDSEIKLNVQSLENAARANGVDLSVVFPDGVDALATSIVDKSSTLTKALQTIRNKAGEGKSKYVQEQLKSGRDLRDIYGSYINAMAKAFNVDADTIDINDALLQKAFSDKGATKLNDFQTLLEKDDRYIGTPGSIAQANTKEGALKQLNQVAKLNGIDLAAKYGTQVDQWVNDILKGKDINSIAQTIRNDAAADKPKYVKDQLALGNDLRDIYGNYINQMASALGIDANTIDVNDPLLANVFTDKGPINNVEFKNLLRTDPRYKTTTGAIGESQVLQAVKDAAVQIGATISDADAADIAAQAASKGLGTNSPEIAALIRSKIAYTPGGKVTGAAGTALQDLRNTAMANGMDLDKMFGTQVQDWLQKIAQGESPETYKKLIRETAQVGLPDTVKKLMSQGVDLSTVYSPYKNMMGSILEINPDTIDINDPTLRAAIGPDKEMSLYDWQRALRKDPRWQYTNNAKAEVSNAVQGVLKDFGFIG